MSCAGERFAAEVAERRDQIEDDAEDRALEQLHDAKHVFASLNLAWPT